MERFSFAESDYATGDRGAAFHQFVCEWLAVSIDTPLNSYLAPGKDGAIDLFDLHHQGVLECKFVGEDGLDAIRPRWKEVERHLLDNLLPDAPRHGQSQYRPWYNTNQPILHYHFCASSRFNNHAQGEALRAEIRTTFALLAQRSGLAHLAQLSVEVLSWDSFDAELVRHPQLKLRWFGTGEAGAGLQEFSRVHDREHRGFQAYLYGPNAIGYVRVLPTLTPMALLANLTSFGAPPAMVLHGRGGAGKSRLMVEVGRAARQAGWVVLVAQARSASPEALVAAVRAAGQAQVLVLMDYVERCAGWDAWMYQLDQLTQSGAQVRLLGTCRSSFTDRLDPYQAALVPLPETLDDTVAGMLTQRDGLLALAPVCRGVPVFAAFLCFLKDRGDVAALNGLRGQQDFGRWLLTHIAQWPGHRPDSSLAMAGQTPLANLTELLLNLPCTASKLEALEAARPLLAGVRQQLLTDGWLEFDLSAGADHGEAYAAVHDVLADGAMGQWLQLQRPQAAEASLLHWMQAALDAGTLDSMLRALQRVAKEPAVAALRWHSLFRRLDFGRQRPSWRDPVLAAGLMSPRQALGWLQNGDDTTEQVVGSQLVMSTIAAAIEEFRQSAGEVADPGAADEVALLHWADAAVSALGENARNDVLVQALRCWPARYDEAARRWLAAHAEQRQAQFLLNAWLDTRAQEEGTHSAEPWCWRWMASHRRLPVASFVFSAWLDAQGERSVVQPAIDDWLAVRTNALSPRAQFIFSSWLKAQGEKSVVQRPIVDWMAVQTNALSPASQFLFHAWLSAQGEKSVVGPAIVDWLAVQTNALAPAAQFLFQSWLDAQGEKSVVQSAIVHWLAVQTNALSPAAPFVLKSWLDAQGERSVVQPAIVHWLGVQANALSPAAQFVFNSWLYAQGEKSVVQSVIVDWLAVPTNAVSLAAAFVFKSWLDAQGEKFVVQPAMVDWLAVRANALAPTAQLVFHAWLDAEGERSVVQPAIMDWLAVKTNALSSEAGYVFEAWGDSEKHLPEWMWSSAEAWFMAWRDSAQDVLYPLKYIARIPSLSLPTVQALLIWCAEYPDALEALSRLQRMSMHFRRLADRRRTLAVTGDVILRALAADGNGRTPFDVFAAAVCIANACALSLNGAEERRAFDVIARAGCTMLRCLAESGVLDLTDMHPGMRQRVVQTDWARLLSLAMDIGESLDPLLRKGMDRWSEACRPWANRKGDKAMYVELQRRARAH